MQLEANKCYVDKYSQRKAKFSKWLNSRMLAQVKLCRTLCTKVKAPEKNLCVDLLYDHVKNGVLDHYFWNLIGCSPGSIFPYSERPAFHCQFSLLILDFTWLSYSEALTNPSVCTSELRSEYFQH